MNGLAMAAACTWLDTPGARATLQQDPTAERTAVTLARGACLLCLLMVLGAAGCATRPRTTAPLGTRVTLAVLDGTVAPEAAETRRSREGWWFSSRDRYDNANAPALVAEAASAEFARIPGVEVFSRTDLDAYMMQKERLLRRRYPELTAAQRLEVLASQDPIDYGRSLNVDYVLTNHVRQSRLVHNRAFHWWYSTVDFDLALYDVESGARVWVWHGRDTLAFRSQISVIERMIGRAREQAELANAFSIGP